MNKLKSKNENEKKEIKPFVNWINR